MNSTSSTSAPPAPERTPAAQAAAARPMPAVARHPMRHLTQVRVAGVLEADAQLLPASSTKPERLQLLLRPQRGLPYLAVMALDSAGDRDAVQQELAAHSLRRGALLTVAGNGLELHQHEGQTVLTLTHAHGLVIPH